MHTQRNNIKSLIERFLHQYCVRVHINEEDEYMEIMLENYDYILYEQQGWYVPKDISPVEDEEEILRMMIINTFTEEKEYSN